MIQIKDKKDCCGCNACGDICAKKAITFPSDNEGFWYPLVDTDKCTNCGLCEKVCPMLHLDQAKNHGQKEPRIFGGFHKNITIRFDSTSGGAFSALANAVYKQGGYVAGAVFNEDWSVSNFISNNKKDLSRLRSSKYVESNAEGLYLEIKRLLIAGEKVLACGSPCQMAALRTYLGKDYDNLIIVDFLCRATNSPKAYRKYLDMLEEQYGGKIVYIKAKNKDHGWRSLARKVVFDNGKVYYGEETRKAVGQIRTWMATYSENETMITSGIYVKGNSPEIDIAIDKHMAIEEFLKQEEYEPCPINETLDKLAALSGIEIPQEEYIERPAAGIPTTAQIVDASKQV